MGVDGVNQYKFKFTGVGNFSNEIVYSLLSFFSGWRDSYGIENDESVRDFTYTQLKDGVCGKVGVMSLKEPCF